MAETYGPVMSLRFGQKLAVVVSSPAAEEEMLKIQGQNFSSRPKSSFGELALPEDTVFTPDTPTRRHLKKILHTQLSTTKQLQLSESVRAEEIAHVLRAIPHDGTTVVPVRPYIEMAVTNILSRMILKKRFCMAVGGKGDEAVELEQVRNVRELAEEIGECALRIDPGDFIPIFKWIDIQGFKRRLRNLRKRMDAFMSNIVNEHLVQRQSNSMSEKSMLDVFLDQKEDETLRFEITDTNVRSAVWVRMNFHATYFRLGKVPDSFPMNLKALYRPFLAPTVLRP